MNRLICTTVLLAAVALAGCKREEHPARQRIAIATTIEPLTRAPQLDEEGSGRFADTDRLTLLVSDDAAQQSAQLDRKSTRLNSSHVSISYAVFCLKKKKYRKIKK